VSGAFDSPRIDSQVPSLQFRVNPEYARRIALRNQATAEPLRVPIPPSQPREETPPPHPCFTSPPTIANSTRTIEAGRRFSASPGCVRGYAGTNQEVADSEIFIPPPQPREESPPAPPRLHSPPPPAPPTIRPFEILTASQAKRKRGFEHFELVINVPAKRFKASRYLAPRNSDGPTASSSGDDPDRPATVATRPQARPESWTCDSEPTIRKISVSPFRVVLKPEIRNIAVTREFLRAQFGAQRIRTFSRLPRQMFCKHGYDHFVFVHRVRVRGVPFPSPFLNKTN
jgi:hypothetical protein